MEPDLKLGEYVHYKGNHYEVLCVARNRETLEKFVVYKALYGVGDIWLRPYAMFTENVEINGEMVPRFKLIKEKAAVSKEKVDFLNK